MQCTIHDSVIITGIKEHPNENCIRSVENFLENTSGIMITEWGVQTVYQSGSTIQRMISGKNLHSQDSCLLDSHQNKKTLSRTMSNT